MDIFSVLQVCFIVLKVLNLIDWSWWLVFVPSYIWIVIVVFAISVSFIINMDRR